MSEARRTVRARNARAQRDLLHHTVVGLRLTHLCRTHVDNRLRDGLRVYLEVEESEGQLAEVEERGAALLRGDEVVADGIGQRLARLHVLADALQYYLLTHPLLHQLRWRLHEVRLGAERAKGVDALVVADHVDEVSELVEDGRHVVVRHRCGVRGCGLGEVADHRCCGELRVRGEGE